MRRDAEEHAAAAQEAFASIMDLMSLFSGGSFPGIKAEPDYRPKAFAHDGVDVSVAETKLDFSELPEAQRGAIRAMYGDSFVGHFAAIGKEMLVAFGDNSREPIGALIDAVRGKGPTMEPSPVVVAALAEARAHKESAIMVMDLASFMRVAISAFGGGQAKAPPSASALRMGIGFADGNCTMRFTIDAALIRDLKGAPPQ